MKSVVIHSMNLEMSSELKTADLDTKKLVFESPLSGTGRFSKLAFDGFTISVLGGFFKMPQPGS